MATDLNLDSQVEAVEGAESAVDWYSRLASLFRSAFRSTDNPFGSAAKADTGTGEGDVPLLGTGGRLAVGVLPEATTSQAGIFRLSTAAEDTAGTSETVAATPATVQTLVDAASVSSPNFGYYDLYPISSTTGISIWSMPDNSVMFPINDLFERVDIHLLVTSNNRPTWVSVSRSRWANGEYSNYSVKIPTYGAGSFPQPNGLSNINSSDSDELDLTYDSTSGYRIRVRSNRSKLLAVHGVIVRPATEIL